MCYNQFFGNFQRVASLNFDYYEAFPVHWVMITKQVLKDIVPKVKKWNENYYACHNFLKHPDESIEKVYKDLRHHTNCIPHLAPKTMMISVNFTFHKATEFSNPKQPYKQQINIVLKGEGDIFASF